MQLGERNTKIQSTNWETWHMPLFLQIVSPIKHAYFLEFLITKEKCDENDEYVVDWGLFWFVSVKISGTLKKHVFGKIKIQ
jgi:hypothetical protein